MKKIIAKAIVATFFILCIAVLGAFLVNAFIEDWKATSIGIGITVLWFSTIWALKELSHD